MSDREHKKKVNTMKTVATHKLICEGNTRPAKEELKKRGWTWNPKAGHWYMMLVDAHAARVPSDEAFFRGLGGHRKGCRMILDGVVVWTSKTYGVAPVATPAAPTRRADPDGYGWNCDQFGNRVVSKSIPGSDPADQI